MGIRHKGWASIAVILLLYIIGVFTNEEHSFPPKVNAFMAGLPNKAHKNRRDVDATFDSSPFSPLSSPPSPPSSPISREQCILQMGKRGKKLRKEMREERRKPTPPRIQTPYGRLNLIIV